MRALLRTFARANACALRAALARDAARWPAPPGDPLRDTLRAEAARATYTLHRLGYTVHMRKHVPGSGRRHAG